MTTPQTAPASIRERSPAPLRLTRRQRLRLRGRAAWRQFRLNWAIFSHSRLAMLGLALIVLFALLAAAHPVLMATVWPYPIYNPVTGFDFAYAPHPSPPSLAHPLGTDVLGKDVLSLLMVATRSTFVLGLTAALTTAVVGTLFGSLAAYFQGGWVDQFLSHAADAMLLIPAPLFMIIIGSHFRDITPLQFGLIYGVISGMGGAAIVLRAHALTIMNRPFIAASRVAGGGGGYIIRKHLLPHMLPLAALYMMLSVTGAVVADGFISFFGFTRAAANWGSMIYSAFANQHAIASEIPWNVLIPPAMAISLFAGAFYFVGRGLQEIADPRLRKDLSGVEGKLLGK